MADTYLELNDDVGLNPDGNPEPCHVIGVAISLPTLKGGEIVDMAQRVDVHPIAGTRVIKTDNPLIVSALLQSGLLHECDAPSKKDLDEARKSTTDARESAGTHEEA